MLTSLLQTGSTLAPPIRSSIETVPYAVKTGSLTVLHIHINPCSASIHHLLQTFMWRVVQYPTHLSNFHLFALEALAAGLIWHLLPRTALSLLNSFPASVFVLSANFSSWANQNERYNTRPCPAIFIRHQGWEEVCLPVAKKKGKSFAQATAHRGGRTDCGVENRI